MHQLTFGRAMVAVLAIILIVPIAAVASSPGASPTDISAKPAGIDWSAESAAQDLSTAQLDTLPDPPASVPPCVFPTPSPSPSPTPSETPSPTPTEAAFPDSQRRANADSCPDAQPDLGPAACPAPRLTRDLRLPPELGSQRDHRLRRHNDHRLLRARCGRERPARPSERKWQQGDRIFALAIGKGQQRHQPGSCQRSQVRPDGRAHGVGRRRQDRHTRLA